jgi:hypothetical protein
MHNAAIQTARSFTGQDRLLSLSGRDRRHAQRPHRERRADQRILVAAWSTRSRRPPCIRQCFLPCTAGDMQGLPKRVLAPERGLDSIGPVLRGWSPAIRLTCVLAEPEKTRVHLRSASELLRIRKGAR